MVSDPECENENRSRACGSGSETSAQAKACGSGGSTSAQASAKWHAINRDLAELLGMGPAPLALGAEVALGDELVVCGILGGKDVGKTTLINALAQCEVSVDTVEVGKGTERPMAYVHEAMQSEIAHRLAGLDGIAAIDVTPHRAEAIRNVVLVDLPDFDSEFRDHLEIVRRIAPLLDRVLWVVTPRKIGDRAWVEMFHSVIKDPRNVHCVLNKLDELLADGEPPVGGGEPPVGGGAPLERGNPPAAQTDDQRARAFWDEQTAWVARSLETAGCPHDDDHRFLIGAAYDTPERFEQRIGWLWNDPAWAKHAADRNMVVRIARLACDDLDRLRACVLSTVGLDQATAIKKANEAREQRVNVDRLRRHFELDRTIEQLALACDPKCHQEALLEAVDPAYRAEVAAALQTQLRSDTELADELLERRVECWPLLRLAHWPFGWVSRILGRRISPHARARVAQVSDPFDLPGPSLMDRVELMRSRFLSENAVALRRLEVETELPPAGVLAKRVSAGAGVMVPELDARLLDDIRSQDRRPSLPGRASLWLVFLWFPFLQPILAGGLEMFSADGALNLTHGLYRVVSAFSAAHLLTGFAVVAGVYVMLLAAMYARALRTVRKLRTEQDGASPLVDAVDDLLLAELVVPLAKSLHDRLSRLTALRDRLENLSS